MCFCRLGGAAKSASISTVAAASASNAASMANNMSENEVVLGAVRMDVVAVTGCKLRCLKVGGRVRCKNNTTQVAPARCIWLVLTAGYV
jgi:hypothetical protein